LMEVTSTIPTSLNDGVQKPSKASPNFASAASGQRRLSTIDTKKGNRRLSSVVHDEVNHLIKTGGTAMARATPLTHEKPELKDPLGIQCVSHLQDPRWKALARGIRDTIYDPEFYDDGTYAPMYVRVAIHAAVTWDQRDGSGGCEGGAMRYKPEYSDAHNKFAKHILKRQHELIKVPFPWASYADIQVLASYVSIECAGGPVIPFSPGRRDVRPDDDFDFVYLNYHVRGDLGQEAEGAPNRQYKESNSRSKLDSSSCPFLTKTMVMPGRVPAPEDGNLGKPQAPVTPEMEKLEWKKVAHEIRHHFLERCGTTEQYTVALIAGGHSFGRCHPEISGYAGPWQSNPGYFNNVYCKKLLTEDWKLVDSTMEDCSGDLITGVKPKGMRRQYVNKGGKGDLMMLVSDMAMAKDPVFKKWLEIYASDVNKLKEDFAVAFKWITEVGFTPPPERTGVSKLVFDSRVGCGDCFRWLASKIFVGGGSEPSGGDSGASAGAEEAMTGTPYTMEDVTKHTAPDDCWVVINRKVCDLSKFKDEHPGGVGVITNFAGKDVSAEWNVIHSKNTIEKLAPQVKVGFIKG